MANRVSPVRKLLFFCFAMLALLLLRIHIPDVLGVSRNTHAWGDPHSGGHPSPLLCSRPLPVREATTCEGGHYL